MFKESDKHFTNMFGKIVGEDPKKLDIFLNKTINPYIISIKGSITLTKKKNEIKRSYDLYIL